ncbi:hypothetical protein O1M63_06760 [Streptomyces mirabilis]|nr:hypothetical protein [Streptomyces mirabilis]
MTDSPPDGSGAVQAMEAAIGESGLGTAGIDYVVAHGTSTHGNDQSETVAIKKVFADDARRLVVSAPKSMAGHLTSASLGLGVLAALGAIRHSWSRPPSTSSGPTAAWTSTTCRTPPARCRWRRP